MFNLPCILNFMNEVIFRMLNSLSEHHDIIGLAAIFFAEGFGYVLIAILGLFLLNHKHPGEGVKNIVVILSTAMLAWIIAKSIKFFYIAPRPFLVLDDVHQLIDYGGNDAFPSGHATFFSALGVAVYFYHKRIGIAYLVGALLIALSRVVVGVHWPLDIFVGYILGGGIALLVHFLYYRK